MQLRTLTRLVAGALACGLSHIAQAQMRALPTAHVPAQAISANYVGPLPKNTHLRLAITLPMHKLDVLEDLLGKLQDRRSPQFRRYLSVAEFTSRFGPTEKEYGTLLRFAADYGLSVRGTSPNRFVLDVEGPVGSIERAFHVRMGVYRRSGGPGLFHAPDREPRMEIATPVLHISGLDDAQPPVARASRRPEGRGRWHANGTGPNGDFTASDMRAAYYGGTNLTGAGQIVGLIAFSGFNIADVQQYFNALGSPLSVPVIGISVDGVSLTCTWPACDDYEQSIDIEQTIGMAPGLTQVSVYAGNTPIDILNRMATDNTAKSLSSSYGWGAEAAVEDPVYMEFAAQGQSFVDATGDMGAQLQQGGVWPADDAHVIAVGGTNLATSWPGGPWYAETAWSNSGGGPSPNNIHVPKWQRPFVNALNMASRHWRNVPDVAAEAAYDNYACYDLTCNGGNGGTSFAAPRWAGFLALANEQAALQQEPNVGFINWTIYPIGGGDNYNSDFHDITQGSNGTYPSVAGFDDVTGFGSPQPALLTAMLRP